MKTMRAVIFPREAVPLAVNPHYGEPLSNQHDLWRESDRFMRSQEFVLPMARARRWAKKQDGWGLEDFDG